MFKALNSVFAVALALLGSALAQDIQQPNGPAPFWVLRGQGVPASIDFDFQGGRYYHSKAASGAGPGQLVTVVRASSGTDLLPTSASGAAYSTFTNNVARITPGTGLLVEGARTNQLLNSTAPVTQTTGSLANATYTLWVNGAGSATMSAGTATGCGTGAATQGTPVSFTTTGAAGTCTVTVAGALNAFQLEAGTFGSSLIVTAGATATRAADSITVTNFPIFGTTYSLFGKGTPYAPTGFTSNQLLLQVSDGTNNNRALIFRLNASGNAAAQTITGGVQTSMLPGVAWAAGASGKLSVGVQDAAAGTSFNGGAVAAGAGTLPVGPLTIISVSTALAWYGEIERFALWPNARLPNADLQRLTGP